MIDRAAAARDAGLDSLFVGDHHAMPVPYYQNVPILGRLLAEWNDKPAGCLFLFPLWNPVLVAEQVGTLASIARGRFIVQCGLGAGRAQFDALGANIKHRPSLFEQSIGIIRRLLAGESVSSEGRYNIHDVRISPVPADPIEFWVGGSAEPSIDRAARLGDAYLAGPELTPAQAAHWAKFYLARCADYGRKPAALAIRRDVFVGSDAVEARSIVNPLFASGYPGRDPSATAFGDTDEVTQNLSAYAAMGYTDILVRHITDDQSLVLSSLKRLGDVRKGLAAL
jgi:alkanesulfonate monooxygenase SsuD/methylene tetrahydromethanopterin reductase-like flavin-dependent oxidoreductase (luciferase family)